MRKTSEPNNLGSRLDLVGLLRRDRRSKNLVSLGVTSRMTAHPFERSSDIMNARAMRKRSISTLLFLLLLASGIAPANAEELGRFVSIEDPGGKALSRFHDALRRAEKGKGRARILFYGDSHIARDRYPGIIRRELQERFGDGGSGFVPIVAPFTHYRHEDLVIAPLGDWKRLRILGRARPGPCGVFGIAAEAEDEAVGFVRHKRRSGLGSRATHYDLFYLKQPGGGTMEVRIDGGEPRVIPTAGKSSRLGFELIKVRDGAHELRVRTLGKGPVRLFGASVERYRPGVIVDTLGIPGARARHQLPWSPSVQRAHLRRLAPDLFVLAYGTNESGSQRYPIKVYERDLRTLVERIKASLPRASCLLVGPSDLPEKQDDGTWAPRARTLEIAKIQRHIAAELGCGFFDTVAFMGGHGSMPAWVEHDPPLAREDYVHFTREGYERLAAVLGKALLEGYEGISPHPRSP